ncbi:hypothetical protein ACF1G0_31795 [Streptomyces sp. NPDC013953]|uniref:hypothetical protein n=1 Tax=Streptomyces sp. NPDC013953 TaxID=3364868 RepID=UPI0036F99843
MTSSRRGPGEYTGLPSISYLCSARAIPSANSHPTTRAPSASASSGVASMSAIAWK